MRLKYLAGSSKNVDVFHQALTWKDTGGYLSKTVTAKTDTEGKLSKEKEIEVQDNVEIGIFSKRLLFRTINKLINADITSELRKDLKGLKKNVSKFDDNVVDLVGIKLRPYQVALAPGEENGREYQKFMMQAVDKVANDIEGFMKGRRLLSLKRLPLSLGECPHFSLICCLNIVMRLSRTFPMKTVLLSILP